MDIVKLSRTRCVLAKVARISVWLLAVAFCVEGASTYPAPIVLILILILGMSGFEVMRSVSVFRPTQQYKTGYTSVLAGLDALNMRPGDTRIRNIEGHRVTVGCYANRYSVLWRVRDGSMEYDEDAREDTTWYDVRDFTIYRHSRPGLVYVKRDVVLRRTQRDGEKVVVLRSSDEPLSLRSTFPWRNEPIDIVTLSSTEMHDIVDVLSAEVTQTH